MQSRSDISFAKAVQELRRNPAQCLRAGSTVVRDLINGWGNTDWAASESYVRDCIAHALATHGPVLECGSGVTTVAVGIVAQLRGYDCWSLEHNHAWAERVQRALRESGVTSVTVSTSPLRNFGDFDWYEPPLRSMPAAFRLVICDGPPGATRGGRYGLVPVMRGRFADGCIILLDDANREAERLIAARWMAELGAEAQTRNIRGRRPYIRLLVPVSNAG